MKYSLNTTLNLPREQVVTLFDNPENMQHWQKGFISMNLISGEAGTEGAQSLLKYQMGKRTIEMTETIKVHNLPEEFTAIYEAQGVWNLQRNLFNSVGDQQTEWVSESEFKFSGFMKLISWIMPGSFKKQSWVYMEDFKAFAENGTSVAAE